jgi:hypothetical protein
MSAQLQHENKVAASVPAPQPKKRKIMPAMSTSNHAIEARNKKVFQVMEPSACLGKIRPLS